MVVTGLRLALVYAGPDLDTDSYGHAVIGRLLRDNWTDVSRHWVWLPLWHFVYTLLSFVNAGLREVRLFNVALAAVMPFVLMKLLRERDSESAAPYVAGCFASLFPLWLEHSTTGEPEPLFTTLFLLTALLLEKQRSLGAGLVFAVATVLRYEAWAILPAFVLLGFLRSKRALHTIYFLVAPTIAIAAWCILHRAQTGEWLQFLRLNREFVAEARTHDTGVGPKQTVFWYLAELPWEQVDYALMLAPVGLLALLKRRQWAILLPGLWLLSFVTYGWVRGQHLGLERHFYAIVPLYAAAIAYGPLAIGAWVHAHSQKVAGALAAAGLYVSADSCLRSFKKLKEVERYAFASEREAAKALSFASPGIVFCDLPRVEVFSRLESERFIRWNVHDLLLDNARGAGVAYAAEQHTSLPARTYVVSHPSKFARLLEESRASSTVVRWLYQGEGVNVAELTFDQD
jgi:Glycosyltransferase family 87